MSETTQSLNIEESEHPEKASGTASTETSWAGSDW